MFSKTVIQIFCVAFYFLQCQGAGPTKQQLEKITKIVSEHHKPSGLHYEDLLIVFDEVKQATGARGNFPSRDELEVDDYMERYYTKDEVLSIVRDTVGGDSMTITINKFFEKKNYSNNINFEELCRVFRHLDERSSHVVKTDLLKRTFPVLEEADIIGHIVKNLIF
ncbi:uncharacterized protein LOC126843973 [Adelges cooleyi]|uniref:uncharacterized protein LOC126843973 n=1 Tax=Adelges cooleyi TaxID=133065 RepID=UPI00217F68C5|nr:uncharacterized protein LOC126843973 [Adelges cooleyi]